MMLSYRGFNSGVITIGSQAETLRRVVTGCPCLVLTDLYSRRRVLSKRTLWGKFFVCSKLGGIEGGIQSVRKPLRAKVRSFPVNCLQTV